MIDDVRYNSRSALGPIWVGEARGSKGPFGVILRHYLASQVKHELCDPGSSPPAIPARLCDVDDLAALFRLHPKTIREWASTPPYSRRPARSARPAMDRRRGKSHPRRTGGIMVSAKKRLRLATVGVEDQGSQQSSLHLDHIALPGLPASVEPLCTIESSGRRPGGQHADD